MKHFKRWLEEQEGPVPLDALGSKRKKPEGEYDPFAQGKHDTPGDGASDKPGTGTGSGTTPAKKGDRLKTVPPLPPVIDVPTLPTPATPSAGQSPKPSAEPKNIGTSGDAGRNPFRDSGGGFGATGDRPTGGSPGPGGSTSGSGPGLGGTGTGTGAGTPRKSEYDWSKRKEYGTY